MDLIVCGDALWISCGTWTQIWSGTIGAFVAAVIGGLVALMVVRLTNAHQSKLAARSHVIAALADFNAAISELPRRHREGAENIRALVIRADAASGRITMDMDDAKLAAELDEWPLTLGSLALLAFNLRAAKDPRADEADVMLREASRSLTANTKYWGRVPRKLRRGWANNLRAERESLAVQRKDLERVWIRRG